MNLENYWKFFSKRKLKKGDDVTFMENGSFAISSANEIEVFNNKCEKVFEHNGKAHAFENGLVVGVSKDKISVIFGNGESVLNPKKNSVNYTGDVTFLYNAVAVKNPSTNKENLYLFNKGMYPQLVYAGGIRPKCWKVAKNGMFSTVNQQGVHKLFNAQGTEIEFDESPISINLLDCGSFIVHYSDRTVLYNETLTELAVASSPYSIFDLGGYYVRFEDKLILEACYGSILDKYDNKVLSVTPDGTKIYENEFVKSGRAIGTEFCYVPEMVGYWLGGTFKFAPKKLVLIFSGGYCYPMKFRTRVKTPVLGIYSQRLNEMMLDGMICF